MKNDAGSKKSSQDGRLKVEALQLTGPARLLSAASGEGGLFMVLSGSGMLFWNQGPEGGVGAGPGSVLLLGRRDCDFEPAGGWPAELLGCRFPLEMMTEVQKARLVDGSKGPLVLLGDPVWSNRVHTLLELAAGAWQEPDCPGRLYLSLLMHYVGKEAAAEGGSASQPRNETIEKICAYLTANYNQKLTLSSVAALLPQPAVPAGDGAVHRGLYQRAADRGGAPPAGEHRPRHQRRGRGDGLFHHGPLPPGVPRAGGGQPHAVPQSLPQRQGINLAKNPLCR